MNRLYFALILALLFFSCESMANISEDLSPAELIQRAHEAMDRNRYKVAIQYYQALHDRNQSNIDLIITAEYHIAFIHYKEKKYEQAKEEFNGVLAYYNSPDEELLPKHFKKLSQIVISNIEEKEKRKK
ncbi:outer membrane protein assembly factor BamD [Treponema sp. R80B11-R83G3]